MFSPLQAALNDPLAIPISWAVGTSALLCVTFATFEAAVETARERVPRYLRPTIDSLLAEMATLGFIGLLVQADTFGLQKGGFAVLSQQYLGEAELGYELFEEIHELLFRAAVAYFTTCAFVVSSVAQSLEARFGQLDQNSDGILSLEEFEAAEDVIITKLGDLPLRRALRDRQLCQEAVTEEEEIEAREKGGWSLSNIQQLSGRALEELIEVDPLTIFLITTPLELPALVIELTAHEATIHARSRAPTHPNK